MELVDGPTLADLIVAGTAGRRGGSLDPPGASDPPGSLDPPEAIRIARQIAHALEAAHERGITHRDLKPSNVKIAADGSVKVLDFGLAKLSSGSDSSMRSAIEVTASPTLMSPTLATGVGVILGTAAYMSPEQARGKAVDKRADIWAFGCVLYEMLTGSRAFSGEDVSDTLAGILRGDPDWSLLPSGVSPIIRQYLKRCLAKDPAQRVHDIADVRLALEGAFDVSVESVPAPAMRPPRTWKRISLLASAVITAGAVGAVATWMLLRQAPPSVVRLSVIHSGGSLIAPTAGDPDVAVSPDGSRIAYISVEQGRPTLYVRSLDKLQELRIEGSGTPRSPFFSPDGASVGFSDGSTIKRISANGGPAVTIASALGFARGASWGDDDTIVLGTPQGLMRVSIGGGKPAQLTKPGDGEADLFPEILPGGRAVLFTRVPGVARSSNASNAQVAVVDLASGTIRMLAPGSHARYASSGHLVYGFEGTLRAVPFDVKALTVTGNPVVVVDRVVTKASGAANFALSQRGTLVYEAGDVTAGAERTLVWVDRAGREEPLPIAKRSYGYPRVSPDGKRVALDIRDQENDIWVLDLARGTLQRLTFDPGANRGASWTPDGKRVVFSADREGAESLFWQNADGSGAPERLTTAQSGKPEVPYAVTPDGKQVMYGSPGQPPFDLFTVRLDSERKQTPLLAAPQYSEHNAEVSPDGRWLVYQSDESGSNEIYVRRFPTLDSRSQVSNGGGTRPVWSRDGRELFYLKADGAMVAVPVERSDGTAFVMGAAKALFEGQYFNTLAGRTYDVSPDGKRFLMIKNAAPSSVQAAPQLTVVLSWFEELKRLVPSN
jgi:serine/threonine-protein kinase